MHFSGLSGFCGGGGEWPLFPEKVGAFPEIQSPRSQETNLIGEHGGQCGSKFVKSQCCLLWPYVVGSVASLCSCGVSWRNQAIFFIALPSEQWQPVDLRSIPLNLHPTLTLVAECFFHLVKKCFCSTSSQVCRKCSLQPYMMGEGRQAFGG